MGEYQAIIKDVLPYVLSGIGTLIAWAIRVETVGKSRERDIERIEGQQSKFIEKTEHTLSNLQRRQEALEEKIAAQLLVIEKTLSRMETTLFIEKQKRAN